MATPRQVLHVDMDAFFVSVELLRNEHLRNTPVVVGGTGRRGVVAAASYEARAYGIHSALPTAIAKQRCPQATFLAGDHQHYHEVSERVMEIFSRYSPVVEPLSLDEAFLDIGGTAHLFGGPQALAEDLRARVLSQEHLHCSVGVAPNKFLAKLASEAAKPTVSRRGPLPGPGVVIVQPDEIEAFLRPLGVGELWGVGKTTQAKLERIGVVTVGDLADTDVAVLERSIGVATGQHLFALAHGIDDRPVVKSRAPKSISHEMTYADDVYDRAHLERDLLKLSDDVAVRLRSQSGGARRVVLKIRFGDFRTWTRQQTVSNPKGIVSRRQIAGIAKTLLDTIDISDGIRLIGVGVCEFGADGDRERPVQLSLAGFGADGDEARVDADERQEWDLADDAIAEIRARFGDEAIGPASLLSGQNRARIPKQPWGPDRESPHR